MDSDLKQLDYEFLKDLHRTQFLEIIKLQRTKKPENAVEIQELKNFVISLEVEIKRRDAESVPKMEIVEEHQVSNQTAEKDFTSHDIKNMSQTLQSEVPIFSSGHDVHVWLNKLQGYYKLFVGTKEGSVKNIMEKYFVQVAKSRLCCEYLNSMTASEENTDTFEAIKDYMKKNHASKLSVFQIMDEIWDMEKTDAETLRDYGIRLDDKALEAEKIITAKFDEWKNSDEASRDKNLSISDIFKLVSGQVFLQSLKLKKQVIYNNICNDLDRTWSAAEIANKAMTYSDRMTSGDQPNQTTVPTTFAANSDSKPKTSSASRKDQNKVCYNYLEDKCRYGEKCWRKHDQKLRDMFSRNKQTGGGDGNKEKSNGGTRGNNRAGKDDTSNSKNASCVATRDEIPSVPLPTQNFRQ